MTLFCEKFLLRPSGSWNWKWLYWSHCSNAKIGLRKDGLWPEILTKKNINIVTDTLQALLNIVVKLIVAVEAVVVDAEEVDAEVVDTLAVDAEQ